MKVVTEHLHSKIRIIVVLFAGFHKLYMPWRCSRELLYRELIHKYQFFWRPGEPEVVNKNYNCSYCSYTPLNMCIVQQTFLLIVDDTNCIHINATQDCEHMHYIINPALPWYVYLIASILLFCSYHVLGGLSSIAIGHTGREKVWMYIT